MAMNIFHIPATASARKDIVQAMAAQLRIHHATGSERDALRCLMGRGFRDGDVVALVDDALFEARQAAVADIVKRA
jgi:hypothetical protein